MNKEQRQLEVLINSIAEVNRIEAVIDSLPRGYISVKRIAGHTYYYRQWREGDKIVSSYVPEAFLNGIKQKIVIRKENEQLLKIVKKDLTKAIRLVTKAGLLDEEKIQILIDSASYDNLPLDQRADLIKEKFPHPTDKEEKVIEYYIQGLASYNLILLASWGF